MAGIYSRSNYRTPYTTPNAPTTTTTAGAPTSSTNVSTSSSTNVSTSSTASNNAPSGTSNAPTATRTSVNYTAVAPETRKVPSGSNTANAPQVTTTPSAVSFSCATPVAAATPGVTATIPYNERRAAANREADELTAEAQSQIRNALESEIRDIKSRMGTPLEYTSETTSVKTSSNGYGSGSATVAYGREKIWSAGGNAEYGPLINETTYNITIDTDKMYTDLCKKHDIDQL